MPQPSHRLYIDYVTGNTSGVSKEHTVMLRINGDIPAVDAGTYGQGVFLSFLSALTPANLRSGWRAIRGRLVPNYADWSLPYELTPALLAFVGSANTGAWTASNEAIQLTWIGRSTTTGKRARLSLYGASVIVIDSNFRYTASEWGAAAGAAVTALNQAEDLVAVDNSQVFWYSYVNANYNSYWESRIRRG